MLPPFLQRFHKYPGDRDPWQVITATSGFNFKKLLSYSSASTTHTFLSLAPKISSIVHRYSSQKCITTITTVSQQMSDHRRDSCFPMCASNTDIKRTFCDHLQNITSLYNLISILLIIHQLFMILWVPQVYKQLSQHPSESFQYFLHNVSLCLPASNSFIKSVSVLSYPLTLIPFE